VTAFTAALRFLTVLPWGVQRPEILGRSLIYFPAIGLLLGAGLAVADRGLHLLFPAPVVNALLLLLSLGLTGGMHLDGLLDCCDALPGIRPPEERLRILQDPHVGAFGIIGGITVLLLKYGALLSLTGARTASLILFPALGRWGMVYAVCRYPYHNRNGEGTGTVFELHQGLGSLLGATAMHLAHRPVPATPSARSANLPPDVVEATPGNQPAVVRADGEPPEEPATELRVVEPPGPRVAEDLPEGKSERPAAVATKAWVAP